MEYSDNQMDALRKSFLEQFNTNHIVKDMMDMLDDFDKNTLNDYIMEQFITILKNMKFNQFLNNIYQAKNLIK